MKELIAAFLAMGPAFVIAQAIGPVTTVLSVLSAQMKNITAILMTELLANLLIALSYILLGGLSGSYICLIACVQALVSFIYAKKKTEVPKIVTGVFILCFLASSVISYKTPMDILPAICAVAFALSLSQSSAKGYRIFMTINTVLWIIYDISISAWGMIITHGLLLVSLIIAMIRQDKK